MLKNSTGNWVLTAEKKRTRLVGIGIRMPNPQRKGMAMEERESDVNAYVDIDAKLDSQEQMDVSITDSGAIEVGRDHAIKYGVPGASDAVLAGFLLNLAERDGVIVVTHGVIATLVEAAARIDGSSYLAWIKQRECKHLPEGICDGCLEAAK